MGRAQMKAVVASIKRDNAAIEELLALYGVPGLQVRFEDLVSKPDLVVARLQDFVGPLDTEAALAQVIDRPTDCLPYMLEHRDQGRVLPVKEDKP